MTYVTPDNSDVAVTATTARLYDQLPGVYRDSDTLQAGDRPLLRWLACLTDQAGAVEAIYRALADPDHSALTDPALADAAWLGWLAQLVGLRLPALTANDPTLTRTAISGALTGAQPGTRAGIIAVIQEILSGTKTVTVTDHYSGDQWQIQVNTLAAETPAGALPGQTGFVWDVSEWDWTTVWEDPDPVVWKLTSAGSKPAGYTIVHTTS